MNTKGPEANPFLEGNGIFCLKVLNKIKSQKTLKNRRVACTCNPQHLEAEVGGPLGLLARQPSRISEVSAL